MYDNPVYDFKIIRDDRFISVTEGLRTMAWERANQFATRVYDTQEKAFRDALIAMGWTPPTS